MVWMRTATDSTFTKLHRIINDLSFKKGDKLNVTIVNYFEVSSFGGSKSIVISTNSAMGGQNDTLGILFIVVGALALVIGVQLKLLIPFPNIFPYEH